MSSEPAPSERQRVAFEYLRDRARRAHSEGDGILVNSLCALALSHIESLAERSDFKVTVKAVRWALVFPVFWLVDDYMLRSVQRAIEKLGKLCCASETAFFNVLKAHHFLVFQPLVNISSIFASLMEFDVPALDENSPEDFVLATHLIELVWLRAPNEGLWISLIDRWIAQASTSYRKVFEELKSRLTLQTRLVMPNSKFPHVTTHEDFSGNVQLVRLWVDLLNCDAENLDAAIERLSAEISPESHVARLLFDFHHLNRFHGHFGEPQEVGLTRRRLFTASSPLLVFNEIRQARLAEVLAELFRRGTVGQASTRFYAFQLACISEVAALRLWDWGGWRKAVAAQAEAYLEASKWPATESDFAAHGVHLAVQSVAYKPKKDDALIAGAVDRLEFANLDSLNALYEALMFTYPRQQRDAFEALNDLSDLAPEAYWARLAQWVLKYISEIRNGRHFGSPTMPLSCLAQILFVAPKESELWSLLEPEVILQATQPLLWDEAIFSAWIQNAPLERTKRFVEVVLSCNTDDPHFRETKFRLLLNAANSRKELQSILSPQLRLLAENPAQIAMVLSQDEVEKKREVKKALLLNLAKFLQLVVPPADATEFKTYFFSNAALVHIIWEDADIGVCRDVVSAIDHPRVLTQHVFNLLMCLETIVRLAPISFAKEILPQFVKWIHKVPTGSVPHGRTPNPFSIIQIHDSSLADISQAIGWLGFQLLHKLQAEAAPIVAEWIHANTMNPEPRGIAIMIYTALPAAVYLDEPRRTDLVNACFTVLSQLWSRHKVDRKLGALLAEAIDLVAQLLHRRDHPWIKWDDVAGRGILEQLLRKLSPFLIECSSSPTANVRASTAKLLHNLGRWRALPEELQSTRDRLAKDNRARVRAQFAAANGTTLDDEC